MCVCVCVCVGWWWWGAGLGVVCEAWNCRFTVLLYLLIMLNV